MSAYATFIEKYGVYIFGRPFFKMPIFCYEECVGGNRSTTSKIQIYEIFLCSIIFLYWIRLIYGIHINNKLCIFRTCHFYFTRFLLKLVDFYAHAFFIAKYQTFPSRQIQWSDFKRTAPWRQKRCQNDFKWRGAVGKNSANAFKRTS